MAFDTQTTRQAAAMSGSLRRLAIAGLAGGLIALAAAHSARAADDAPVAVPAVTQKASTTGVIRQGEQPPASPINREYLIKAAILFNFAKFAAWPETAFSYAGAPLRICVLGDDPFGVALDSLQGKQVQGRSLVTTRIGRIEESPQCHILFVSSSEQDQLANIIDYAGKRPILTVADMSRFANSGGIIALKEVENRSRIEVNLGAAEQAGLKLSSKLLRLADTVSTQAAQQRPQ